VGRGVAGGQCRRIPGREAGSAYEAEIDENFAVRRGEASDDGRSGRGTDLLICKFLRHRGTTYVRENGPNIAQDIEGGNAMLRDP